MASQQIQSPLTGVLAEENVVIDFGVHEGKSVLQVNDENPDFYSFLLEQKDQGNSMIKRTKDKIFRLYVNSPLQ
jgi:hypothetical protein